MRKKITKASITETTETTEWLPEPRRGCVGIAPGSVNIAPERLQAMWKAGLWRFPCPRGCGGTIFVDTAGGLPSGRGFVEGTCAVCGRVHADRDDTEWWIVAVRDGFDFGRDGVPLPGVGKPEEPAPSAAAADSAALDSERPAPKPHGQPRVLGVATPGQPTGAELTAVLDDFGDPEALVFGLAMQDGVRELLVLSEVLEGMTLDPDDFAAESEFYISLLFEPADSTRHPHEGLPLRAADLAARIAELGSERRVQAYLPHHPDAPIYAVVAADLETVGDDDGRPLHAIWLACMALEAEA